MSIDILLQRAREQRPSNVALHAVAPLSGRETYEATMTAILRLIETLDRDDLDALGTPYGSVRELLGHLVAVERDFAQYLRSQTASTEVHTEARINVAMLSVVELHAALKSAFDDTLVLATSTPSSTPVKLYGIAMPLSLWLTVRGFEVWTHDEDIRRSTGRPLVDLEPARLAALTDAAVTLTPFVLDADVKPIRLVLTGSGGGVFEVGPVGYSKAGPDAGGAPTVVVDTMAYCRLAARRLEVYEAEALVESIDGDDTIDSTTIANIDAERFLACVTRLSLD